ncbi:MAG: Do family serine endopeptidase [Gammaproteobacteria bacterium]|nr:Do family serine endopeptidase [Gammaproteobacteria bacterium]
MAPVEIVRRSAPLHLLLLLICVNPAVLHAKLPPAGATIAPMLEKVLPAVVNISTRTRTKAIRHPLLDDPFFRHFFDIPNRQERQKQSLGSGVIVDAAKGYILTNHHVIEGADEITVTLRDQRQFTAEVAGSDPEVDLALIRIGAKDLAALPIADSDQVRVGDFVVAIGNPFGLGQTVTYGIVSALGRSGLGIEGYEDFIQTDASINPGNSGGALVNMSGELVGVNTAIVGPSGGNIGIGFAIPGNMASTIMTQLATYGEVRRGQLGLATQDLTPELASAFSLQRRGGALVARVAPGSAAEQAGVRSGDVIVSLNDRAVANSSELRNAVGLLRIGTRINLGLLRNGRLLTLPATIADPLTGSASAGSMNKLLSGALLGAISDNHPLAGRVDGVQVLEVEHGSPAWSAGLRADDIIESVNQRPVSTLNDVAAALKRGGDTLLLNIRRGNSAYIVVIH